MNIDSLSIEPLADLRDKVISTLNDWVSAKQKELLASSQTRKPPTARDKGCA
jgi:hypothetical protein